MARMVWSRKPSTRLGAMVALVAVLALGAAGAALAWGHQGHRIIGYLAIEGLPADTPAFLRASADDIGELAREPDRVKGSRPYDADMSPAHYIDLDDQAKARDRADAPDGPSIDALPENRAAFDTALRAAGTDSWRVGYLPYSIIEGWQKLKTDLAYWRVIEAALKQPQTPVRRAWLEADLRRREALIITDLGNLAHYVGDGSQPLHVTMHFNGWGNFPNPRGYATDPIHAPFEAAFVQRNVTLEDVRAAMSPYQDCNCPIERRTAGYLRTTWTFVEPLYALWKAGGFQDGDPRGKAFATARVAAGASELRDLIIDAWRASATAKVGWPAISAEDVAAGRDPWVSLHGDE